MDYLRRLGDAENSRSLLEADLQYCESNHIPGDGGRCHRVLGDFDFDAGNYESALTHYESALKIARSISIRDALIEALLARERFYAKAALQMSQEMGYHWGKVDASEVIERLESRD